MSVNTSHANNGVLIHAGEYILLHSDGVTLDFSGQDNPIFKGSKQGRIYLTSHRMIFNNKKPADSMQSFSAPFVAMSDLELEQPVFGANYIKGKVRAQPNGNYVGEVKFKLHFKAGGAIEYGQALRRAAYTAQSNMRQTGQYSDDPPPYTPSGAWHEAPPPAYQPPPGYYGWLPTHDAFSGPAPNSVFMSDNPPPYPGIGPQPYGAQQPPPPNVPCQPPPQQYNNNTPSWNGFSVPPQQQPGGQQPPPPQGGGWAAPGGPAPGGGAPGGYPQPPPYGYGAPGYAAPQPGAGPGAGYGYQPQQYNNTAPPSWNGFSLPPDHPVHGQPQQPAQPPAGGFAYPPGGAAAAGGAAGGAMGFSAPPANSKEAEAMASAFNTPYNQGGPNAGPSDMPPPSYNDLPPSYGDSARKPQ